MEHATAGENDAPINPPSEPLNLHENEEPQIGDISFRCKLEHSGTCTISTFMKRARVCALIVVKDGKLRLERYNRDTNICQDKGPDGTAKKYGIASVAKSITSTLLGDVIAERFNAVEKHQFTAKLQESVDGTGIMPELKRSGYKDVPLLNVINMRSGVKWKEFDNHHESDGDKLDRVVKGQQESIIDFATKYEGLNNGAFNYSALDASISGAAAQRFLGTTTRLSNFFEAGIWAAIGAEDTARWRMDKTETPIGACCFYMGARDLARFGIFVLKKGISSKGEPAMPPGWFDLATKRANDNSDDIPPGDHDSYNECEPGAGGLGYRFLWWLRARPHTDFTAVGISGQFLHIYPDDKTVIVQMSDWGRWEDGNFRECQSFLAHDALVEAVR